MVRPWSNDGDSLVVRVRYTNPNISVPIGTSSSPKNCEIRPEFFSFFFQKLDEDPKHKTSRLVVVVVVVVVIVELENSSRAWSGEYLCWIERSRSWWNQQQS
jgi:hypothetical protein